MVIFKVRKNGCSDVNFMLFDYFFFVFIKKPNGIPLGFDLSWVFLLAYSFIVIKNSSLFLVCFIRCSINSIASTGFISAKYFRIIHILCIVCSSNSKSSLLVEEEIKSMAGNILRLLILRSN